MFAFLSYNGNFLENQYLEDLSKLNKKLIIIKENNKLKLDYSKFWKLQTNNFFDEKKYNISFNKIKYFKVSSHNSNETLKLIKKNKIKLLVNLGTTQKLNKKLLNVLKYGILNVHPGLLPYYRGSQCVEWAIINDDPIYLTCHYMSENYDDGRIILFYKIRTKGLKFYNQIRTRVYLNQSSTFYKVLENFNKFKHNNLILRQKNKILGKPNIYKMINLKTLTRVINKVKGRKYKHL